jgi:hypothetical protein
MDLNKMTAKDLPDWKKYRDLMRALEFKGFPNPKLAVVAGVWAEALRLQNVSHPPPKNLTYEEKMKELLDKKSAIERELQQVFQSHQQFEDAKRRFQLQQTQAQALNVIGQVLTRPPAVFVPPRPTMGLPKPATIVRELQMERPVAAVPLRSILSVRPPPAPVVRPRPVMTNRPTPRAVLPRPLKTPPPPVLAVPSQKIKAIRPFVIPRRPTTEPKTAEMTRKLQREKEKDDRADLKRKADKKAEREQLFMELFGEMPAKKKKKMTDKRQCSSRCAYPI